MFCISLFQIQKRLLSSDVGEQQQKKNANQTKQKHQKRSEEGNKFHGRKKIRPEYHRKEMEIKIFFKKTQQLFEQDSF